MLYPASQDNNNSIPNSQTMKPKTRQTILGLMDGYLKASYRLTSLDKYLHLKYWKILHN